MRKVIGYEQFFQQDGEPPLDFFDPSVMFSEKYYIIKPGEEVLLVINGSGYRFMDDIVYPLIQDGSTDQFFPMSPSQQQLCFVIRNCSTEFTISVGFRSSLKCLLGMARVTSKMCYCYSHDLTRLKMRYNNYLIDNDDDGCDEMHVRESTILVY